MSWQSIGEVNQRIVERIVQTRREPMIHIAHSAAEAEPKRAKLAKIVNGRVKRVRKALVVLGNIAKAEVSRNELSEADVERIMDALRYELEHCGDRLLSGATGRQLDIEFDLDRSPA
jgi:hypothetical protein